MGRSDRRRYASRPLAGLVLAAGRGRRFGGLKPLALLDGAPLVAHVVRKALAVTDGGVVVVSGSGAPMLRRALARMPVRIVHNPRWREGLGGSLSAGLAALTPGAAAVLVLLADQPGVETSDLRRLRSAWRRTPDRVIAMRHRDGPGVPALFPRATWQALAALTGDRGARDLLRRWESRTLRLSRPVPDVDNPLVLARLRRTAPGAA